MNVAHTRSRVILAFVLGYLSLLSPAWPDAMFSNENTARITTHGPWPMKTAQDAGNELSGVKMAESLGEYLFANPALSVDGSLSCASCHQANAAFTDGQKVGSGLQAGVRNTQSLLNVGIQRWFGWDGGADSLWAATLRPLLASHEMGNTIKQLADTLMADEKFRTQALTLAPAWNTTVNISDEEVAVLAAKSVAAYLRTVKSNKTPFDDYRVALLTEKLIQDVTRA